MFVSHAKVTLEKLFYIFGYLKHNYNGMLIFDYEKFLLHTNRKSMRGVEISPPLGEY